MSIYASPHPYVGPHGVPPALATPKQISFIQSLVQRTGFTFSADGTDLTSPEELARMGRRQASQLIDALLVLPEAPKPQGPQVPVKGSTARDGRSAEQGMDLSGLQGGRYAATVGEVTKFFRVDVVREGRWAGWVFVKIQASDDLYPQGKQAPGASYRGSSQDYLAAILADEQAAFALYGQELGTCGVCGRTLTDEDSRARGIGPICAEKLGY